MKKIFPGWWQVAAAMLLQAVSSASVFTAYSVVAVPFQMEFAPSRMFLMLGITVTSLASGCLGPSLGVALDRYSLRKLMLAGAAALAAGFLLLSVTSSMVQVLVVYLLLMSTSSLLLGPLATSALLARWFSRRRGLAMGLAASGSAIGGLLIPPLLQALIDSFEWRLALRIFGGFVFLLTVPVIIGLVINRPEDRGLFADGASAPAPETDGGSQTALASTTNLLRNANFWYIAVILGCMFGGPMGIISNLLPFVMDRGIEPTMGALLLSMFAAANFSGKLLCAAVADRVSLRLVMGLIIVLLATAVIGLVQAEGYALLAAAIVLLGVPGGVALPLWSILVARIFGPASIGRVMGMMNLIVMPFMLVAPPLFGWVFDVTGSYNAGYIGYVVLLLCMFLPLSRVRVGQQLPAPAVAPG